ncbi:hypothetical protein D3C86_1075770 [compost metagenome]
MGEVDSISLGRQLEGVPIGIEGPLAPTLDEAQAFLVRSEQQYLINGVVRKPVEAAATIRSEHFDCSDARYLPGDEALDLGVLRDLLKFDQRTPRTLCSKAWRFSHYGIRIVTSQGNLQVALHRFIREFQYWR